MGEARRRGLLGTGAASAVAAASGASSLPLHIPGKGPATPQGIGAMVPRTIKHQVPGMTTLVLDDGSVLVGAISAMSVKQRIGARDAAGNNVYDVEWKIDTGTSKATG